MILVLFIVIGSTISAITPKMLDAVAEWLTQMKCKDAEGETWRRAEIKKLSTILSVYEAMPMRMAIGVALLAWPVLASYFVRFGFVRLTEKLFRPEAA